MAPTNVSKKVQKISPGNGKVLVKYKWSCSKTLSILSQVQHSGSDALVHKLFINDYNKTN